MLNLAHSKKQLQRQSTKHDTKVCIPLICVLTHFGPSADTPQRGENTADTQNSAQIVKAHKAAFSKQARILSLLKI